MAIAESFSRPTAQTVTPAYLYAQYADDESLQALVGAYNDLAQQYLDWFNSTPLSVYTDPAIAGRLLDWVGEGVYGTPRPTLGTFHSVTRNALNSRALNIQAMNSNLIRQSGTASVVGDDVYKRVLTWLFWKGDGVQMNLEWIRRRVVRFLYGSNGGDFTTGQEQNVDIAPAPFPAGGEPLGKPLNTTPMLVRYHRNAALAHQLRIKVKRTTISTTLKGLIDSGVLVLPFQLSITVKLYD